MGWTIPEAQALPVLKRAFDLGINTWDTVLPPADSKTPAHNANHWHS
jgi:aryl-alcohol dehydrogenase-like predicted oxidoreductase